MSPRTERALRQAQEHWKENLEAAKAGNSFDYSDKSCPLCSVFLGHGDECKTDDGEVCPIYQETSEPLCEGSPWSDVRDARTSYRKTDESLIDAVQKEVEFLDSLG